MEIINKESLPVDTTTAHNEPVSLRQQFNNPTMKQSSLRYFLYGFLSLFIMFIIVITLYSVSNLLGNWTLPNPDNSKSAVTASPAPVKKLSTIATDSSFLETENTLKQLINDNSSVDLSEPKLSLPVLEMNVNFEK